VPLTFISLGSGSCGNCYYLSTSDDAIIIDAGIGIRKLKRAFGEYGINRGNIRAIFITHDHSDHVKSAGVLSDELGVPVYALDSVHTGMQRNYMMSKKVALDKRRNLTCGEPVQIADFTIEAIPLPHDATANVGYIISYGDTVFSVMTDVGCITAELASAIGRSTHMVLEANYDPDMLRTGRYPYILKERIRNGNGHLSNLQTAEALISNIHPRLKHVWLCHLSEENNRPDLALETIQTQLTAAGIDTNPELHIEPLRRKLPTGPFFIE